uniref:Uncharacterized protein n=1 Tax=Mesocestoides corti TaxID=53468 RepID=A0A5K3F3H1_MESCO
MWTHLAIDPHCYRPHHCYRSTSPPPRPHASLGADVVRPHSHLHRPARVPPSPQSHRQGTFVHPRPPCRRRDWDCAGGFRV